MPEKKEGYSSENVPHISAYAGDMNLMVPYLREGGPPSQRNSNGDTILHAAADGWQYRMVEFLVLSGADVNAQNDQGDTPLHTLVRSRNIPFEGQFLRGETPEKARIQTFQMLLRQHADPSIQNIQGANPLHLASYGGDSIAVKQLLLSGRGVPIDAVTNKGATALVLAILQEHISVAKMLISFGADVNFTFQDEITPLRLLLSSDNLEMKALYEAHKKTRTEQQN